VIVIPNEPWVQTSKLTYDNVVELDQQYDVSIEVLDAYENPIIVA
jgi:hypothetical protein